MPYSERDARRDGYCYATQPLSTSDDGGKHQRHHYGAYALEGGVDYGVVAYLLEECSHEQHNNKRG